MFEFADIFANELTTAVYLSGSVAMLLAFALVVAAITRSPEAQTALQGLRSA